MDLKQANYAKGTAKHGEQTDRYITRQTDRGSKKQAKTNRYVVVVIASLGSISSTRSATIITAHLLMYPRRRSGM